MKIDRHKFLAIVFSMGLGNTMGGCIVVDDRPRGEQEQTSGQSNATTTAQADPGGCAQWDASGECVAWNDDPAGEAGYQPADECVNWDAVGECIEWDSTAEAYVADDGCTQYDPSGECISWGDPSCTQYDPSGECIAWDTVGEG